MLLKKLNLVKSRATKAIISLLLVTMMVPMVPTQSVYAKEDQQLSVPANGLSERRNDKFYKDQQPGSFPYTEVQRFNHWNTRHILMSHTPHHRGFDLIVRPGEEQVIRGKFYYGSMRGHMNDEWVSIFIWNDQTGKWQYIDRRKTDKDAYFEYTLKPEQRVGVGIHPVKLVVEGDNSSANMYIQVLKGDEKFVVFDIDGTLTLSDREVGKEVFESIMSQQYVPVAYEGGQDVVKYYKQQGYDIIYLTARPHWLGDLSYKWLIDKGFPMGILHTMEKDEPNNSHDVYKTNYLKMLQQKGVNIVKAYGNAKTDIVAYRAIGLPLEKINIIGKYAGRDGTVAITDYVSHYQDLMGKSR